MDKTISVDSIYDWMMWEVEPIGDDYVAPGHVVEISTDTAGSDGMVDRSKREEYGNFVNAVCGMLYCCGYNRVAEMVEGGVYCADFKAREGDGFFRVRFAMRLRNYRFVLRSFNICGYCYPSLLALGEVVYEMCHMVGAGDYSIFERL